VSASSIPSPAATLRGVWLTVASSALAAAFLISYKLASGYGDVADMVFLLLLFAAIFNTVSSTVQARGLSWLRFDRLSTRLAAALASLTLIGNLCSAQAIARISPSLTSVFQQTQVLFVAFLGLIFLTERVSSRFWLGAAIAATGIGLMRAPVPSEELQVDPWGAAFAIASALAFAGMVVLTRKYVRRIEPMSVNALRLWMAAGLWLALERRAPDWDRGLPFLGYCALCALTGPFLSRAALMYALKHLSANRVTLMSLTTPVMTLLPTYWVFGTVPSRQEWLGGLLILVGVAWPLLERSRASRLSG
jgi:drug/metabolite transporter (DMT)-like permease